MIAKTVAAIAVACSGSPWRSCASPSWQVASARLRWNSAGILARARCAIASALAGSPLRLRMTAARWLSSAGP